MSTTIADFIHTNPGYSAQIDLRLFRNGNQNAASLRRYKPITSHRKAFERIAGALDNKDKRVYLITGNYGTGKSHLSLMLANYFAYPSNEPDVAAFLDNYASEDPTAAEKLRARRKKGRYLVALCDYDSTDDFGEVVLRAILDPLQDAGLADELDTPYEAARRKLEQLEQEQQAGTALVDYYSLFEKQLATHLSGTSMKGFKERLYPQMDRNALDVFKRMHHEILRTPFTYEASNLSTILQTTLRSKAFLEKFEGIVVLWDEFGYTLGDPNRLSLNIFQQFAQLSAEFDPIRGKLIFVATAHKDFSAYAPAWAAEDYSKISDRVERVSLLPEGLEDVIGAIVSPDKNSAIWKKQVFPKANPIWSQWLPASKNSGIFEWLVSKPPVFRDKILEGVYPMHPMATYGVINLAKEVASQNRTVFTFFSSEKEDVFEEGSYLWYIHNHAVIDENTQQLNIYTIDLLFDYFRSRLNTNNPDLTPQAKERISNYEASRTQLQRARNQNPLDLSEAGFIDQIMRIMLIYDLIGIHTSLENIAFGLNLQPNQRKPLETQLGELSKYGVIHRNPTTNLYEFRRSDIFDVDRAVEEYKREEGDKLGNLAVELGNLVPLARKDQYLEAKAYNAQHNEDKRLAQRIITPGDLASTRTVMGQEKNYFELLEDEVNEEVNKGGDFEGIVLYVLCETQSDITKARDLAAKNTSRRVAVAVPTAPIAFKEAILNVKAIEEIKTSPEAENFSTQDNALVLDREKGFKGKLAELRDKLMSPANLTWLGAYGKAINASEHKADDAATKVMQQLYTQRNGFSHDDFNRTHDVRNFTKKHLSLDEAVRALLDINHELKIDNKQADNRGEKRYLERCLYQRGALAQVHQQGSVRVVEVERSLNKFKTQLPALADMIQEVQSLDEKGRLGLREFLNKYRQPPYGLGAIALSILLSTVIRFFGDTIKVKKDDAAIGDLHIVDYETVADIVSGNYPHAFIKYREIREGERDLINNVFQLFSESVSAAQPKVTALNTYDAIATWEENQPPVAAVTTFYPNTEYSEAARFLQILEKQRAQDPHLFVLGELQTVSDYDADELITKDKAKIIVAALTKAKDQIEGTLERVQSGIRDGLCKIFNVKGNTWDDLADGVREWYNGLDANQRSTTSSWHNDASKPLAQLFTDLSNPRELFVDKLPERPSYGYGRVRDWNADLTHAYLTKIDDGVRHIEANRIKVPPLADPEFIGHHTQQGENIFFSGPFTLRLTHPDPNVRIFVTDTGTDPKMSTKEHTEFQASKEFDIHKLVQKRRTSVTILYAPQDNEGNWGITTKYTFIDTTLENEIRKPKMLLKEGRVPVTFVFPTDEAGFVTACQTFFKSILDEEVISPKELRQLVEDILDQLTTGEGDL